MGRRATRISHAGSNGSRPRAPFVGRLSLGRPANDNVAPRRPLSHWARLAAYLMMLAALAAVVLSS
jgi:hypothetical protein